MAAVCDSEGVLLMDGVMLMHSARTAKIQKTLASGEVGDDGHTRTHDTISACNCVQMGEPSFHCHVERPRLDVGLFPGCSPAVLRPLQDLYPSDSS